MALGMRQANIRWVNAITLRLVFLPKTAHVLEGLTFGLGHQPPYEDGSDDTDNTIESISKPMSEVVTFSEMHIEHGHEGRTDNEVENPLESHGDSHCSPTACIGEYLGNEQPADGSP